MANIVAITGRPNVGKSTLFNRLTESRKAIMDNESGVTRDRHYGQAQWGNKVFTVVDTGGYVYGSNDVFETAIRQQVEIAIEEASVILFMVDLQTGVTDLDKDLANVIRKSKKPVYVVVNKADTPATMNYIGEFYSLGFDNVYPISAINGAGTGDLLDAITAHFPEESHQEIPEGLPRFAILGRPNVGKSSFLNALLGQQRSIVTDIAGTTRDSIDSRYRLFGMDFIITDTAGLRKKSRIKNHIEFYSVLRSIRALQDSDVCIIMIDATSGIESQDVNIVSLAHRYYKGIVLMVNKWDLVEKDSHTAKRMADEIRARLAPIDYMPILFTSVINKQRIFQTIEKAVQVYQNKFKKIPTSQLNQVLLKEIENYPPPAIKGKFVRIKYITQFPAQCPTFAFYCNLPQYIQEPYQRFLENKMRQHFNLEGVPIRLFFREK
ncbi:MAG: ribosome biogenesis GTPase Der [Cytophagales bacterium]|nr:ribosome biogenesis GTPase Der [Bernardetiaceae bacterium]MDW8210633.1 ribosome biogenesis GTPase Der [Cytophagales bacterium]